MSRYIDADALKERIKNRWFSCEEVDESIDAMPTADVVEVVRCEDCKHNSTLKCPSRLHDNGFFCAQGERRDDEI